MTGSSDVIRRFGPGVVRAAAIAWTGFTTPSLFRTAVGAGVAATAFRPEGVAWGPFQDDVDVLPIVGTVGLVAATCGLFLVVAAQWTTGRIRVADRRPDALITTALFAVSRNPVFLGMLAMAAGILMAVPSPLAILAMAIFLVACELQVRDEERTSRQAFGADDATSERDVRRWI